MTPRTDCLDCDVHTKYLPYAAALLEIVHIPCCFKDCIPSVVFNQDKWIISYTNEQKQVFWYKLSQVEYEGIYAAQSWQECKSGQIGRLPPVSVSKDRCSTLTTGCTGYVSQTGSCAIICILLQDILQMFLSFCRRVGVYTSSCPRTYHEKSCLDALGIPGGHLIYINCSSIVFHMFPNLNHTRWHIQKCLS